MTTNPNTNSIRFAFFGTGLIARIVLEELLAAQLVPALVITAPDAPQGRGMHIAPSHVGALAAERNLTVMKPEKVDDAVIDDLRRRKWDAFAVADYGLILPGALLEIPANGTLNMHPSLLPRLRGASPIRSAILGDERATGVTIMLMDEKMDHGPIVAQKTAALPVWPPRASELEHALAHEGGALLAQILPLWVGGQLVSREQNHDIATYTQKFTKQDGELDLAGDAHANFLKIRALEGWPGTYAYFERNGKKIRVAILDAHMENDRLAIDSVKPEGKTAMPYDDFLRSGAQPCTRTE